MSAAVAMYAGSGALPLLGVLVQVTMLDFIAHVIVEQRFRNEGKEAIEAIYTFPMDPQGVLQSFEVDMDGRKLFSEVEERAQAKQQYEEALNSGQGAALLWQGESMRDVFTLSLGNLAVNASASVRLEYVTQVDEEAQEDGSTVRRFVLPTSIAPRYNPHPHLDAHTSFTQSPAFSGSLGSHAAEAPVQPTAEEAAESGAWTVVQDWLASVTNMATGVWALASSPKAPVSPPPLLQVHGSITSTSRVVSITALTQGEGFHSSVTKDRAEFDLSSGGLERDVVVAVHVEDGMADGAWIDEGGAMLVSAGLGVGKGVEGGSVDEDNPGEYIFVIDRSGSMYGSSIEQARQTLSLCISSLPLGARFNILGFGSHWVSLFPSPRPFDDETKALALTHCDTIQADLGGTEILSPLQHLAEQGPIGDIGDTGAHLTQSRRVILITDGQVTNTDEVIDLVRRDNHRGGTRYFSVGVGEEVSRDLVLRVAQAGQGAAEFVVPGERMHAKAMRQMRRALEVGLREVRVDYDGFPLRTPPTPDLPRPLYLGTRLLSFALLDLPSSPPSLTSPSRRLPPLPSHVTLTGLLPNATPTSWPIPVHPTPFLPSPLPDTPEADEKTLKRGGLLHALAAGAMLRELEDRHDRYIAETNPDTPASGDAAHPHAHFMYNEHARREGEKREKQREMGSRFKDEAIALSLVTQVPCRWTAFVAVDRNPPSLSNPHPPPTPIRIPLSLHSPSHPYAVGIQAMSSKSFMPLRGGGQVGQPRAMFMSARGGGGGPAISAMSLASCDVPEVAETAEMADMAAAPAGHVGTFATMSLAATDSANAGTKVASAGVAVDSPMGDSPTGESPKGRAVDHVDILAWQTAGGAWKLDARLLKALTENAGVERERVEGEGKGAEGEVWATALALALLKQHYGGFIAEWQAGADKGERWMRRTVGEEEARRWRERAVRVVRGEGEEKTQATQ